MEKIAGAILATTLAGSCLVGGSLAGAEVVKNNDKEIIEQSKTESFGQGYEKGLTIQVGYLEEEMQAVRDELDSALSDVDELNSILEIYRSQNPEPSFSPDISSLGINGGVVSAKASNGDILFGSAKGSFSGLFVISASDGSIIKVSDYSFACYMKSFGDKILVSYMSGYSGKVGVYDSITREFDEPVCVNSAGFSNISLCGEIKMLNDRYALLCGSMSSSWPCSAIYDSLNNNFKILGSIYVPGEPIVVDSQNLFLYAKNYGSSQYSLFSVSLSDLSVVDLGNVSRNLGSFCCLSDGILFAGVGSSSNGLFFVDLQNNNVSQVYSSSKFTYLHKIDNENVLCVGNEIGIFSNGVYTNISSGSNYALTFLYEEGDYVFFSGLSESQGAGIFVYDKINQSISHPFNYGAEFQIVKKGQKLFFLSVNSNNYGLNYFDLSDGVFKKAVNSGNYWNYYLFGDYMLLSGYNFAGSADKGVWLYNFEDDSISQVFSFGYNYDFEEFDDENVLIYNDSYRILFNKETKTAVLQSFLL